MKSSPESLSALMQTKNAMNLTLLFFCLLLGSPSQAAGPVSANTNLPGSTTNPSSPAPNSHGGATNVLVELFKNLSAIAVIAGGLWVLYHYVRGRTYEKRLLLDIKTTSQVLDKKRVLFVEVQLTNAGKGVLKARRVGPEDYVYEDESEQLKYSCSLQIKRLDPKRLAGDTYLDWYECPALEPVPDISAEVNLLGEYIVPAENNEVVFWLEPGDIAHLPAVVILGAGHYLLKVSFYGTNPDKDFWSRLVYVRLE